MSSNNNVKITVISKVPYHTDKGEHTALYKITTKQKIMHKTSRIIYNYIVLLAHYAPACSRMHTQTHTHTHTHTYTQTHTHTPVSYTHLRAHETA